MTRRDARKAPPTGGGLTRRALLRHAAIALGSGWLLARRRWQPDEPLDLREGTVPVAAAPGWLAGDLHCHTGYSTDVWTDPDPNGHGDPTKEGWTPGQQIAIAEARGLDFLAITDHGTVRALADPGYRSRDIVLVPGYEHSLALGHAGLLGVTEVLAADTSDDGGATRLIDSVHATGGIVVINHPRIHKQWTYSSSVRGDSCEVWNNMGGGEWPRNLDSYDYWAKALIAAKVPATGGSDNHLRSASRTRGVGQPTTWVYATERTWQGILAGIAAGRTTVSWAPPSHRGARLFLTAETASGIWMIGDTIRAGYTKVGVRVLNGARHRLRLVVDGKATSPVVVRDDDETYEVALRPARFVRAELYLGSADPILKMRALTSPIHFHAV